MTPAFLRICQILFVAFITFRSAGPHATELYLNPTTYIDSTHPAIVEATKTAIGDATTERARAVRIHDFVRDRVQFGWSSSFYDQKASDVLRSGVGYCNTKSTLFVAMLRAAGISARQHFVNINSGILTDFINPGTDYVDHSFTEVKIDGQWQRVDSYIVDGALAERARARLRREGRQLGYGVHVNGVSAWDGTGDAYSQFVNDGAYKMLTTRDHGVFEDVGAFYASDLGVNKLNFGLRLAFGFFSRGANEKIDVLRRSPL